jgi:hypothetical protein
MWRELVFISKFLSVSVLINTFIPIVYAIRKGRRKTHMHLRLVHYGEQIDFTVTLSFLIPRFYIS